MKVLQREKRVRRGKRYAHNVQPYRPRKRGTVTGVRGKRHKEIRNTEVNKERREKRTGKPDDLTGRNVVSQFGSSTHQKQRYMRVR